MPVEFSRGLDLFFAFHSATDVYNSTEEDAFSQVKNGSEGGTSCCTQFIMTTARLNVQCWKYDGLVSVLSS